MNSTKAISWKEILNDALGRGATHVHLGPATTDLTLPWRLRFRVGGELCQAQSLAPLDGLSLLLELKEASSGDELPFTPSHLTLGDHPSAVLKRRSGHGLGRLGPAAQGMGLPNMVLDSLRRAFSERTGLVVIASETQGAPLPLLYGLLAELDQTALNLITIEDCITQWVPGWTQLETSSGETTPDILRRLGALDPDVTLVADISEGGSAQAAAEAAARGHFIAAGLHLKAPGEDISKTLLELTGDETLLRRTLKLALRLPGQWRDGTSRSSFKQAAEVAQ